MKKGKAAGFPLAVYSSLAAWSVAAAARKRSKKGNSVYSVSMQAQKFGLMAAPPGIVFFSVLQSARRRKEYRWRNGAN